MIIYTDGGKFRDHVGYGVFAISDGYLYMECGNLGRGTNNVAEIFAVYSAFVHARHSGEQAVVHSDSQYVVNSLNVWWPRWKSNGWRKSDGKPVKNRELLIASIKARAPDTGLKWVRGHNGDFGNEVADSLATAGARMKMNSRAQLTKCIGDVPAHLRKKIVEETALKMLDEVGAATGFNNLSRRMPGNVVLHLPV